MEPPADVPRQSLAKLLIQLQQPHAALGILYLGGDALSGGFESNESSGLIAVALACEDTIQPTNAAAKRAAQLAVRRAPWDHANWQALAFAR